MKLHTLAAMLCILATGCTLTTYTAPPQSSTTALQSSTTTPYNLDEIVCMEVPDADHAQLALTDDGHLDYSGSGAWTLDGVVIGWAPSEDSSFHACGTETQLNRITIKLINPNSNSGI